MEFKYEACACEKWSVQLDKFLNLIKQNNYSLKEKSKKKLILKIMSIKAIYMNENNTHKIIMWNYW